MTDEASDVRQHSKIQQDWHPRSQDCKVLEQPCPPLVCTEESQLSFPSGLERDVAARRPSLPLGITQGRCLAGQGRVRIAEGKGNKLGMWGTSGNVLQYSLPHSALRLAKNKERLHSLHRQCVLRDKRF